MFLFLLDDTEMKVDLWRIRGAGTVNRKIVRTDFVHFAQDVTQFAYDVIHFTQRVTMEQNFVGLTYDVKNDV